MHDNVSYIQSLALTPNNQIVIGGNFTSYNNQRANDIARLNANGSLDTTFATGAGFNGMVWSVLFPVVAMQRGIGFRILLVILLISNVLGFCSWATWTSMSALAAMSS